MVERGGGGCSPLMDRILNLGRAVTPAVATEGLRVGITSCYDKYFYMVQETIVFY